MLRETRYLYQRLSVTTDLALCVAAFFVALWIRNGPLTEMTRGWIAPSSLPYLWPLLYLFPPLAVLFWFANDVYRLERVFQRRALVWSLGIGLIEAVGALILLRFFFSRASTDPYTGAVIRDSRGQILLVCLVAGALAWARAELARVWLTWRRRRGLAAANVLIVGSGENLRSFLDAVMAHPLWGFRIEGLVSDHPSLSKAERVLGHPVVATADELGAYIELRPVDEVIFVPGRTPLDKLAPLLRECETMGVRTRLSLNFFSRQIHRTELDSFDQIPVITYNTIPEMNMRLLAKSVADRLVSALALVILSPLMTVIALAIRRGGPAGAPVFFRQRRVGRNGRLFTLYKFRSMVPDAERRVEELRAHSDVDGPRFKMRDDPRVTPVGRWLRRWSLDELPQLWNVLKGDMSLIGPRPPLPEEVAQYTRAQRRRLSMKPGMTCLWAVRGRDQLDWEEWMRADLEYIDTWSLWLDVRIALRTIWAVLRGKNAY